MTGSEGQADGDAHRRPLGLYAVGGLFVIAMAVVVASSLVRAEPPSYLPSPAEPRPLPQGFVVDTVTIDARDGDRWAYFDFERRSPVDGPAAGWDLAFNRYHIIVNGGPDYAGAGGAIATEAAWEEVAEAPASGYATTDGTVSDGAATPGLERWYSYGFFSHLLEPKDETYVARTAEGRYAKFRILSYYCPGATPGCVTLRYGFQPDGTRRLSGADPTSER